MNRRTALSAMASARPSPVARWRVDAKAYKRSRVVVQGAVESIPVALLDLPPPRLAVRGVELTKDRPTIHQSVLELDPRDDRDPSIEFGFQIRIRLVRLQPRHGIQHEVAVAVAPSAALSAPFFQFRGPEQVQECGTVLNRHERAVKDAGQVDVAQPLHPVLPEAAGPFHGVER